MKKKMLLFIISAVVSAVLQSSFVQSEEFSLKADGGIESDGLMFSNMQEYLQSDYFRAAGKRCGVGKVSVSLDGASARSASDCSFLRTSIQDEYRLVKILTLPVWWHVITSSKGLGSVSDAAIAEQMQVLNEDYRAMAGTMGADGFDVRIQFRLEGITRTVSDAWFTDSDADEAAYKRALAVDPVRYINIYTNDARGYLGYASFPQIHAGAYLDGIVLLYYTVGGRNNGFYQYNQGRTLVHEMGHYLGLFHTFEGYVCSNTYSSGDLIVDTHAEDDAHYGCTQSYTCGSADAIHNYMNYTDDSCMNTFSPEQANRTVCSLINYRPDLAMANEVVVPSYLLPLLLNNQ